MQIISKENQAKENRKISYLGLDDKILYYKEIVHHLEFIKLYQNFIKIEGKGLNRNPFVVSITKEGKGFLELIKGIMTLDYP